MSRAVAVAAYAKVNLTLEVLGRRDDGYHDLASVFALVSLADRVTAKRGRALDVRLVPPVGAREDLTARAARAYAASLGREPAVSLRTRKRIPVAAGLGGGSSDAAAALAALADLWGAPPAPPEVAASLGSDVPFFAARVPAALVGGRGERIEPLPAAALWVALVPPRAPLATPAVFAAREPSERGDGARSQRLARAFRDGTVTATLAAECAHNDLRAAAERLLPALREAREAAARRGVALHLSGSGPALFALADEEARAIALARALRRAGLRARVLRAAFDPREGPGGGR